MEAAFSKISYEIQSCEKESESAINALNATVMKWESIKNSFTNFSANLGNLSKCKGLQSKLEMEQIVNCDSIIAELGRQLVLFEHSLTQCRTALAKAKQLFESRPLDVAWSFPPEENDKTIGDQYEKACKDIERAAKITESRKLCLFNLTSNRESLEPEVLLKFIKQWNNTSMFE